MGLKEYKAKRRFVKTPEPKPGKGTVPARHLVFVVHKHAARALHYDLRLELEGALKSWAVPKGPSLNPSVKRLAVMVEDHPLEYRDFEGVIPEGNYGAGSVIIWDRGFYRHPAATEREQSERLLLEGLSKGDLKFLLAGEKLMGEFALVKTGKDGKSWLLLKKKDRYASREDILGENRSVVSNRTLEGVFEGRGLSPQRRKKINRIRLREALEDGNLEGAPEEPMPHRVKPMLATPVREPFDDEDWIFEVKWDGYRAIAEITEGGVALYSRKGISLGRRFSAVGEALRKLGFEAVLDGEVVVVDDEGRPDFQMLQNYGKSGKGHLLYYVFDLLYLRGRDLTGLPLIKRKELLKKILSPGHLIRYSDHVPKEGILFFNAVNEKGLEGIVAKRSGSAYRPGRRSRDWLKIKTQLTQEGVIAGFTEPKGGRRYFGSLVLGAYEGKDLVCIGHSGGGFPAKKMKELRARMEPLIRKESPFKTGSDSPVCRDGSRITWVRPELVCEVAYRGWTEEGIMRQPVFLRLREDKAAREVVREEPAEARGRTPRGRGTPHR